MSVGDLFAIYRDGRGKISTFDAEDRLTQASGMVGGPYCYVYDGEGLRVAKISGGSGGTCTDGTVLKLYWRSLSGDALAETDGTGSTTNSSYNEYVFFGGRRVASRNGSGAIFYWFADQVGSTRSITTGNGPGQTSGQLCYDADFTPYGQEMDHSEHLQTTACPPNYRFTGYEYDSETGLYYAFARYYSPRLGRFLSTDPIGGSVGYMQSENAYAYVQNDPLNSVDPTGTYAPAPGQCAMPAGDPCGGGEPIDFFYMFDPGANTENGDWGIFSNTALFLGCNLDLSWGGAGGAFCPLGPWLGTVNTVGNGTGGAGVNFGHLVGQTILALQNPNCAALFGGAQNAVRAMANSSYNLYTPGEANPDPNLILSNNWSGVVDGFKNSSYYGFTLPYNSKPGGITFFGNGFSSYPPGFASAPDQLTQETGFLHELEHAATNYNNPLNSVDIDINYFADRLKLNINCQPMQTETQSTPIPSALAPPE